MRPSLNAGHHLFAFQICRIPVRCNFLLGIGERYLAGTIEQGDPSTKVQRFVANEFSGFIPAFAGDIARATDRTYRKPDTIAHALESRIPGMTEMAPGEYDVTGQPSQRPFSQLGGANPFPISPEKNDPVLRELGRLGIAQPQPPAAIKTGKDDSTTINLTPDQQAALMKQEGQLFRDRVAKLMAANGYPRRNDDQRRQRINEIHEEILRDRKDRVMRMVEKDLPPPIPVYAQLPPPILVSAAQR